MPSFDKYPILLKLLRAKIVKYENRLSELT